MPTPGTFASAKQFVGVAKEPITAQGTAVAPTYTMPMESFKPSDKPVWLDDKAWRGSMGDDYGRQQGVIKTDWSASGACFGDTLGFFLANILGDDAYSGGTPSGSPTTTTGALTAGSSTVVPVTSATGITPGVVLQLDTAGLLENVTVLSVASLNVTLTAPVAKSHLTAASVQVVTAPFTSAFSLYNAGQGQSPTHTFTHFQGPAASTGTRQYPGSCLSDLTLKWDAESQLFTYDAKALSWPSVIAGATPTSAPTTVAPVASWRGILGIAGPASGGTLVKNVTGGEITIKRELEAIFTSQNAQTPYIIQRGKLSVSGKLNFIAVDEAPYLAMINNTQPQLQLILDNGAAGALQNRFTVDSQQSAYRVADYNAGKAAVEYAVEFDSIFNTTNVGDSGGMSPCKVSLVNAVAPSTYQ